MDRNPEAAANTAGGSAKELNILRRRMLNGGRHGQHFVQNALERHRVAAHSTQMEKLAIALPIALFELDLVVVVVAAERNGKLFKMEAIGFLGIAFGFFDFSDHSVIHARLLGKKKARERRAPCHLWFTLIVDPLRSWRFSSESEGSNSIEDYPRDVKPEFVSF
jgi:hypothetical protein